MKLNNIFKLFASVILIFSINSTVTKATNFWSANMGTPTVVKINSDTSYLRIPVYLQNISGSQKAGNCDFNINYNDAALSLAPANPNQGGDSIDPTGASASYNSGKYGTSVTTFGAGVLSMTLNFTGSAAQGIVPSATGSGSLLGTIVLFITDPTQDANLSWNSSGLTASTFLNSAGTDETASTGTTGGGGTIPLPVTLTNFSANISQSVAQIRWTTASEINNAYFTIERSGDGQHFVALFNRDGAGNTQKISNYVAYDEQPLPGTSYYRLSQTDFNGKSMTFYMVSVYNPISGQFSISSVSPSSFQDNATLYYKMPAASPVRLVVADLTGRIIEDVQVPSSGGDNKYQFENTQGWMPGMYIATMYFDGRSSYIKMVKN